MQGNTLLVKVTQLLLAIPTAGYLAKAGLTLLSHPLQGQGL